MNERRSTEDIVRTAFAAARETPDAPFEEDRFLAFLTSPPAPSGRRVRDTFAGRRRFARFVEAVQLEAADPDQEGRVAAYLRVRAGLPRILGWRDR